MVIGQVVEGVAAMPPGPELAALLDTMAPERVPNDDIDDVLIAHARQLAHAQARMLAVLAEVVCRRPFAGPGEVRRGEVPEPYGADEVRAALVWTRRAAESETDFAYSLVRRLPRVFAALEAGSIDRGRARVFVQHLCELTDPQTAAVCAVLVPIAGRLTTGQLDERLKRIILEIDPEHYEHRYRRSVRERRVVCYLDAEGTATLSGSGLPAAEAAAAIERVESLARAARQSGHPGTLHQIRADLMLGLLDGSLHTLSREEIIDALITRYTTGNDTTSSNDDDGGGNGGNDGGDDDGGGNGDGGGDGGDDGGGNGDGGGDGGDDGGGNGDGGGDGGDDGGDGDGGGDGGDDGGGDDDHDDGGGGELVVIGTVAGDTPRAGFDTSPERSGSRTPAGTGNTTPAPGEPGADTADPASRPGPEGAADRPRPPVDQRVGVEIQVPLLTALGHDDRAGQIPGLGPVTAATARRTVAGQRRASWRWVVLDPEGHLVSEGITRHRPRDMTRTGPPGGIVELHIAAADLADLAARLAVDPRSCRDWAGVISDIAAQYQAQDPAGRIRDLDRDPGRRFPTAAQRRHVEVRDRTCTFPGCRAPAHRADIDHTVDHHHGGPTVTGHLTPLCRHDHMAKTEGGWQLHQPAPGRFVWTSPLGQDYPMAPEPILAPRITPVPRDPDPTVDDPTDPDEHPLDLPTQGRAPPPHEPHTDHRAAPPRAARPVTRAPSPWSRPYQPPAAERDTEDDPPPF